jgi:hypothetical protein
MIGKGRGGLVERKVIIINGAIYRQFADALLSVFPGFPMDAAEIEVFIQTHGIGRFILTADCYDPCISEVLNMLAISIKGGAQHGER